MMTPEERTALAEMLKVALLPLAENDATWPPANAVARSLAAIAPEMRILIGKLLVESAGGQVTPGPESVIAPAALSQADLVFLTFDQRLRLEVAWICGGAIFQSGPSLGPAYTRGLADVLLFIQEGKPYPEDKKPASPANPIQSLAEVSTPREQPTNNPGRG